jgi:putative ABC transport system permease protein
MLFRRGGTAAFISAVALLIAIPASTNSIYNSISYQTQVIGELVNLGRTYLILSADSRALTDSQVERILASRFVGLGSIDYVLPQRVLVADLATGSGSYTAYIRGVEDVGSFLKTRRAYLNGAIAKGWAEANIGEILARALSIGLQDEVDLAVGDRQVRVKVVGVYRSQTQSDAELLVPIETANILAANNHTVSLIELSLKEGVDSHEALSQITKLLPENVKLVQPQQLREFTQQMNTQTLVFLNVWSLAVYAAVAAASHIAVMKLITESSYELAMLRALGARKHHIYTTVLAYTMATALLGSILGIALGTAGAQVVSTILRWIHRGIELSPFMEPRQALQIVFLALASSVLGCLYPAFKTARVRYVEQPL